MLKSLVVLLVSVAALGRASLVALAQPPHLPAVVLDARGRPLDTAEVIQARALHLQAKALESQSHYLHKRSLGYLALAPSAVSHQSRVDVHSSPALLAHAPLALAPVAYAHALPVAVSHQSRVDVRSSPVHSVLLAPTYSAYGAHSHLLKKRSLALVLPSAVSHQSRVDVRSSPALAPVAYAHAAPVAYAHALPAAVSHQARVDVHSSPALYSPLSYAPLHSLHSSPLVHAW